MAVWGFVPPIIDRREFRSAIALLWPSPSLYDSARPGYPAATMEWALGTAIGPGRGTAIDVGADAGLLTHVLVPPVGVVIAIEPDSAMRDQFAFLATGNNRPGRFGRVHSGRRRIGRFSGMRSGVPLVRSGPRTLRDRPRGSIGPGLRGDLESP